MSLNNILIIDDQPDRAKCLDTMLQKDYQVISQCSGSALNALSKGQLSDYAAVLLSVGIQQDVFSFLSQLRTHYPHLPVLLIAPEITAKEESVALSMGAADVLRNELQEKTLQLRLSNVLRRRSTDATAERDLLTGVLRRETFYQRASALLRGSDRTEYEVVCTNIVHFKLINDLYGEEEGNRLLQHLAHAMEDFIPNCRLCGRLGSDIFAALVEKGDTRCFKKFHSFLDHMSQYPLEVNVVVKVGVFTPEDELIPIENMCDRAMLACRNISDQYGVFCALYDDTLRQRLLEEKLLTDNMQQALDTHQFQIYLQPKYELNTEKVAGAEALVRWLHPEKGFLSPGTFIPLFERNGFITQMDQYVWDQTCSLIASWQKEKNLFVPVSVNVSRADIYNPRLPEILFGIVKKHGLEPGYLHLEITETAYAKDPVQLVHVVQRLKDLGFVLEMDDFGSGYSSLNMLSELPIDILKLDMKFIQNENQYKGTNNILSFIISLAKWMNLEVIAEGVMTRSQVEMLRRMDCDYVQGYYFAKPMPHTEFSRLLTPEKIVTRSTRVQPVVNRSSLRVIRNANEQMILIVDSLKANRDTLADILKLYFTVVQAENGAVALQFLRENAEKISVVLLDMLMPVMDGFLVLDKMKRDPELEHIPVVVTSQPGFSDEMKALSMGASDYLTRPYHGELVLRRIQNVIANAKVQRLEQQLGDLEARKSHGLYDHTDPLTGLINRTEMEAHIRRFFEKKGTRHAVFLLLDIDNFKSLNDLYGHKKGDEALKRITNVLKDTFDRNALISRMGGDKFTVFLPEPVQNAVLRHMLANLCHRLQFTVRKTEVSCSVGACCIPEFARDYDTLYHHADIALLTAKRLGKNQYQIFDGQTKLPAYLQYQNMDWLLDESNEGILVSDCETHEILYMNNVACRMQGWSRQDALGKKCHQVIWGADQPCPFCLTDTYFSDNYQEKEICNPKNGRYYLIKSKHFQWAERIVRIQFIQDCTAHRLTKQQEKTSVDP